MKIENIKFKARCLENKEWVCGYFYQENDNTYIVEDCQKESLLNRNAAYEVNPRYRLPLHRLHRQERQGGLRWRRPPL